ncbi:MAG: BON domain-containing protein [Jatrophihabitantaceae bacterium]
MTGTEHQTDHELKVAIIDELAWTPSIDADKIGVAITDGAVTLSGQVASYPQKQAAVSAALRVRGVLAIADSIIVQDSESAIGDAELAREVEVALERTVVVPAGSVTATLHDHKITLSGAVAWQYQRRAAQRAVSSLPGVKQVTNTITLDPPVTISPTEAHRRITAALVRNARLDARHIEVAILGTEVRLTGKVTSWAERHQAEYAGWSTPGVTHVDNQLEII